MEEEVKKTEDQKIETPKETLETMPKNTKYFLIGLVVFTILLLFLAVYNFNLGGKNAPSGPNMSVSYAHTSLSIAYPISTNKINYSTSVNIDTGGDKINV